MLSSLVRYQWQARRIIVELCEEKMLIREECELTKTKKKLDDLHVQGIMQCSTSVSYTHLNTIFKSQRGYHTSFIVCKNIL